MSVEFISFADDCRIYARLELEGRRLTDALNDASEVRLTGVLMESLEDGHAVELTELVVTRDDLYAVVGTGGRGAANRRIRTRAHPVEMKLGGYLVSGNIHTRPGSDPLAGVLRRAPMVPLTDARIHFSRDGEPQSCEFDALIVNRDHVEWIRPMESRVTPLPEMPGIFPEQGPTLAKDFTGSLSD